MIDGTRRKWRSRRGLARGLVSICAARLSRTARLAWLSPVLGESRLVGF